MFQEWRRWLTSELMNGYFANRTFFKLHHQLGLLDNPDQVDIVKLPHSVHILLLHACKQLGLAVLCMHGLLESHGSFPI